MNPLPIILLFVLVVLPAIWFLGTYNGLVRIRNHCAESFSNIDTELKRRHNLIPRLVRTVKGYAAHEKAVFEAVTEARNEAQQISRHPEKQERIENQLVGTLGQLMAVVEDYPELKSDRHYLHLQQELVETENRIQHTRRIYNANVRDLNNRVEIFPSNWVAGMAHIDRWPYFQVGDVKFRQSPKV